jgi:hypothetical protein
MSNEKDQLEFLQLVLEQVIRESNQKKLINIFKDKTENIEIDDTAITLICVNSALLSKEIKEKIEMLKLQPREKEAIKTLEMIEKELLEKYNINNEEKIAEILLKKYL